MTAAALPPQPPSAPPADLIRALDWLASADALAAARAELRHVGLPAELADDLLAEVGVRLCAHRSRTATPLGEDLGAERGPIAYARRSLHNVAVDLLRVQLRHPVAEADDDSGQLADADVGRDDLDLDVVEQLALATELDRARRLLHDGGTRSTTISAGLTVLTLIQHPEVTPDPATPLPAPGHHEDPALWAGLWYAGCTEHFEAHVDDEPATVRQRRKRAIDQLKRELAAALPFLGGDHE